VAEKTYSKTDTIGNGPYEGQKRLVAEVLRHSKHPLTACEITILANLKGEYFETLKDGENGYVLTDFRGGGANGIIESVKYHLRGLIELGEVREDT
jgi:hypothetical protein